jgi:hypothetical protein
MNMALFWKNGRPWGVYRNENKGYPFFLCAYRFLFARDKRFLYGIGSRRPDIQISSA